MSQTGSRTLTPREAEVLELVSHGLTNSEAAAHLDVSVHAVKYHLASIYRKLGVANRTEAAGLYLQHLVTLPHTGADHQRRDEESPRGEVPTNAPDVAPHSPTRQCSSYRLGRALQSGPVTLTGKSSRLDMSQQRGAQEPSGDRSRTLAAVAALLHRYTHAPEIAVEHNGSAVWLDVSGTRPLPSS